MAFELFEQLPLELQREILIQTPKTLKQAQKLSRTTREITRRDANRYRCLEKSKIWEVREYLEHEPKSFGFYLVKLTQDCGIFDFNVFIKKEGINVYRWEQRTVNIDFSEVETEVSAYEGVDVLIKNNKVIFNGDIKYDIIELYRKGHIMGVDLKTRYHILKSRLCEEEEIQLAILNELAIRYRKINIQEVSYTSIITFIYLCYNALVYNIPTYSYNDKKITMLELLATSEFLYEQIFDNITGDLDGPKN